jgi:hypothetical protein
VNEVIALPAPAPTPCRSLPPVGVYPPPPPAPPVFRRRTRGPPGDFAFT